MWCTALHYLTSHYTTLHLTLLHHRSWDGAAVKQQEGATAAPAAKLHEGLSSFLLLPSFFKIFYRNFYCMFLSYFLLLSEQLPFKHFFTLIFSRLWLGLGILLSILNRTSPETGQTHGHHLSFILVSS